MVGPPRAGQIGPTPWSAHRRPPIGQRPMVGPRVGRPPEPDMVGPPRAGQIGPTPWSAYRGPPIGQRPMVGPRAGRPPEPDMVGPPRAGQIGPNPMVSPPRAAHRATTPSVGRPWGWAYLAGPRWADHVGLWWAAHARADHRSLPYGRPSVG